MESCKISYLALLVEGPPSGFHDDLVPRGSQIKIAAGIQASRSHEMTAGHVNFLLT